MSVQAGGGGEEGDVHGGEGVEAWLGDDDGVVGEGDEEDVLHPIDKPDAADDSLDGVYR